MDSHTVENFSDFPTGVLIAPVLLILDVQGGDDLSAYQFPDVHFVYTTNPGHGREFTHYDKEEQTISEGSWKQGATTGRNVVPEGILTKTMYLPQREEKELYLYGYIFP